MVHKESRREKETIHRTPGSGGDQASKSKGKGDDALEKASVGGLKSGADPNRESTQAPPDDGGFTEDNPNERR